MARVGTSAIMMRRMALAMEVSVDERVKFMQCGVMEGGTVLFSIEIVG